MLDGLRTVVFAVDDVERAREWYAEVLGRRPYFDQPFYVGFDVAGYELGLQPAADASAHGAGGDTAYWAVEQVPAAVERLVRRHGRVPGEMLVDGGYVNLAELEALAPSRCGTIIYAPPATPRDPAQEVGGGIVVGSVTDPFGNVLGLIANPHFAPPLVAAPAGGVSDRAIVVEATVPLPARDVWALWTGSEGLAAWWLPQSRIELRPGGFFELYFMQDAPAGQQGSEGCRVLSFLPQRMLSFTWNAPPFLDRTRRRPTWVVLELAPEGTGTHLRLTHLGWPAQGWDEEPQWQETYDYFERAWGSVMAQFARHAEAAAPA